MHCDVDCTPETHEMRNEVAEELILIGGAKVVRKRTVGP